MFWSSTTVSATLIKTVVATLVALVAFAGNSVLCRMALVGDQAIDPTSFTAIRLVSGVVILFVVFAITRKNENSQSKGCWISAVFLFIYAAAFSFGYVSLSTGIGALILFGAVQMTMIISGLIRGNRLVWAEWLGVTVAILGFVFLMLPSISRPSISGFILMSIAGIAWGLYSNAGKGSLNPLADTSFNFFRTLPFVVVLVLAGFQSMVITPKGALLAVLSGALASGLGYAIWYIALGGLSAVQAAVLQLLVPIIAAFGGVLFVGEPITQHLLISTLTVLGGIMMVILGRAFIKTPE